MSEENAPDKKWEGGDLFPSQKVRDWSKGVASEKSGNKKTESTGARNSGSLQSGPLKKKDASLAPRSASKDPITPYIWETSGGTKVSQDKEKSAWLHDIISNPDLDIYAGDKKLSQPSLPEWIDDDPEETAAPTDGNNWPVPGSIMRNLLNTRISGDLTKALANMEQDSSSKALPSQEAILSDSSTEPAVSTMTDVMPQTLNFTPLVLDKPGKRKKSFYSIFIAVMVILLLLGGLGTTFFMQKTSGAPKTEKHPTPIIGLEESTTTVSSPTPGNTATVRPGQTATASTNRTPTPVSTPRSTPTIVPTHGATPAPTQPAVQVIPYRNNFEDGQLEGWAPRSSPNVYVQNSSNVAHDGSYSLMVTFSSSDNYPHVSTTPTVAPPYQGQIVTGYVYVAAGSNVKGRMYTLDQNQNGFIGGQDLMSLPTGTWVYLSYRIGSWAQGAATRVGFEFSGSNVVVYIDSVNW